MENLYFAKKNNTVKIPSKRDNDGAYDIYANFENDAISIKSFESLLVPTGLYSAFSNKYVMLFRERGSTGIKNLKINAGVIDSNYRGEIFVLIYNGNEKEVVIAKDVDYIREYFPDSIAYPYEKAICQAIMVEVPRLEVQEISLNQLQNIDSDRGTGALGSSGK